MIIFSIFAEDYGSFLLFFRHVGGRFSTLWLALGVARGEPLARAQGLALGSFVCGARGRVGLDRSGRLSQSWALGSAPDGVADVAIGGGAWCVGMARLSEDGQMEGTALDDHPYDVDVLSRVLLK